MAALFKTTNDPHVGSCVGISVGILQFPTRKSVGMTAIEKVKLLVSLAAIDGMIADREKNYIMNIGLANGVSATEMEEIIDRRPEIVVPSNLTDSEKFDCLFHLVQLMKIDEKMFREELLFCSTIAEKLGYRKDVLFDLMLSVTPHAMDDAEKQKLEAETRKYLGQ